MNTNNTYKSKEESLSLNFEESNLKVNKNDNHSASALIIKDGDLYSKTNFEYFSSLMNRLANSNGKDVATSTKSVNPNHPAVIVHFKNNVTRKNVAFFKAWHKKRGIEVIVLSDADLNKIHRLVKDFPELASHPKDLYSLVLWSRKKHSRRGK